MKKAGQRHSKARKPITLDLEATKAEPEAADAHDAADPERNAGEPETGTDADSAHVEGSEGSDTVSDAQPSIAGEASADDRRENDALDGGETAGAEAQADEPVTPKHDPEPAPQPEPVRERRSAGTADLLAAAVIGGIIVFAGGYGLQAYGIIPAPGGSRQADELAALRAELTSLRTDTLAQAAPQPDPSVEARLSDLASAVAALSDGDAGSPESLAALKTDIAALAGRLDTLAEAAGSGAGDPGLAAALGDLRSSTSDLAQRMAAAEASALGASEAAQSTAATLGDIAARVETIESGQASLQGSVEEIVAGQDQLRADLAGRVEAIEARLAEPSANLDLARAVAATGLRAAIDRGGPFMAELEAFAAVAPDDPATAGLRDLAAAGVPSRAELAASFDEAAYAVIDATRELPPDAGVFDRLAASALSVVKVRKVGDAEGDGVDATTARIEARLAEGDLAAAFAEWQSLPENARAAAPAFGAALQARLRAEELVAASLKPRANGEAGQ